MESPDKVRRTFSLKGVLYFCLGVLYLGFLLGTLRSVPFHPDEATYIYMSRDLDRILAGGPCSICWKTGNESDPLQVERERDAPLTRYAIGLARVAAGISATASNWNWSADWEQNLERGALPSDGLLFAARIPQALFLFLAVLLIGRIGWRVGGEAGGISAAVLLAVNSQFLLHGRRAMAESGLLFGMILAIAVVLEQKESAGKIFRGVLFPLLGGAALAVAASFKYSGLLVAPPVLAGMFLGQREDSLRGTLRLGLVRTGMMAIGFLLVFLALNPVYWCDPASTLSAVIAQRRSLLDAQVLALRTAAPGLVLDSFPLRLLAAPYQLFFAPPAFWDIPNYAQATAAAEQAYLSDPVNGLTSGGILPMLWCFFSLCGLALAIVRGARRRGDGRLRILVVWFLSVLGGILVGVPILWQRYYLPLVPVLVVFASLAVATIVNNLARRIRQLQSAPMDK
jgi:4-amino-4-deoxy-L-arabinose transferase-like glycosyltransferase